MSALQTCFVAPSATAACAIGGSAVEHDSRGSQLGRVAKGLLAPSVARQSRISAPGQDVVDQGDCPAPEAVADTKVIA